MSNPGPDLTEETCQARLKIIAQMKLIVNSANRIQAVLDEVLPELNKAGVTVSLMSNENPPSDPLGYEQGPRYELRFSSPGYTHEHYFQKDEG